MSDTTDTPKYRTTSCDQWVTSKGNDGRWIALSTTETADELNDLERQLAEAREHSEALKFLAVEAAKESRQHREQRDRLAELLKPFALFHCRDLEDGEFCGCHNCLAHDYLIAIDRKEDA